MNKITATLIITAFTVTAILISCGKPAEKKTTPVENKKDVNPNGSSEMASLMRTMMEHGKTMKNEIENNLPLTPYPQEIKSITTAKETDGMIEDRDIFNSLANYHMSTLDSVYINNVDKKAQFNHVVKSCVDCHENYCHGPIPTIKKLYISAK